MMGVFRDELARPLQIARIPSLAPAYIRTVDYVWGGETSRINGTVNGLEAVRNAVWHILHTERHDYAMNLPNEGIELRQFLGQSFSYFYAKIDQVVEDALLQDDRILSVKVFNKRQPQPRQAYCEVEVHSVYGRIRDGFNIPLTEVA